MKAMNAILLASMIGLSGVAHSASLMESDLIPKSLTKIETNKFVSDKSNKVLLNKHDYLVSYYKKTEKGALDFIPFIKADANDQSIVVFKDYTHYQEVDGQKIGVMLRLQADVDVKGINFNISRIQDLGAAAQLGYARGNITVKVWGLDGPAIYKMNVQADLNAKSLVDIEAMLDDIQSKIMNDTSIVVVPVELPNALFSRK